MKPNQNYNIELIEFRKIFELIGKEYLFDTKKAYVFWTKGYKIIYKTNNNRYVFVEIDVDCYGCNVKSAEVISIKDVKQIVKSLDIDRYITFFDPELNEL